VFSNIAGSVMFRYILHDDDKHTVGDVKAVPKRLLRGQLSSLAENAEGVRLCRTSSR
jgi:hypothetical protein